MSTPSQAPIGLMSAMHEELALLLAAMPDERRVTVAGRDFWQGHWQGRPVVVVLSRIGKVAAATTATVLIERFGVQQIVFTGVAGGMGEGVRVGDVVLAERFVQHDMDASPLLRVTRCRSTGAAALTPMPHCQMAWRKQRSRCWRRWQTMWARRQWPNLACTRPACTPA